MFRTLKQMRLGCGRIFPRGDEVEGNTLKDICSRWIRRHLSKEKNQREGSTCSELYSVAFCITPAPKDSGEQETIEC